MLFSGGIAASETAADGTQGDTSGAAAAAENGELLFAHASGRLACVYSMLS